MAALWAEPTVYRHDLFKSAVVLVSGGGTGIGRAIALLLARLGAQVVICGRTQEKLDRVATFAGERGAKILAIATNVRDPDQVTQLFDRIAKDCGPLTAVVNNAGGQFSQAAIDFSVKGWNAVIDSNLNGTSYMMQAAARYWREAHLPGALVNLVAVVDRGIPGIAHSMAAPCWRHCGHTHSGRGMGAVQHSSQLHRPWTNRQRRSGRLSSRGAPRLPPSQSHETPRQPARDR